VRGLEVDKKSFLALIVFIAIRTLGNLNVILFNLSLEFFILSLKLLDGMRAYSIVTNCFKFFIEVATLFNRGSLSLAKSLICIFVLSLHLASAIVESANLSGMRKLNFEILLLI
jgi:hypothetical protein